MVGAIERCLEVYMEIDTELFVHEKLWFPRVCSYAREYGLDWLRLCAAAEVLSNGDPKKEKIDWYYIHEYLGPDNPVYLQFYDNDGNPNIDIVHRGTRWGLFQILGEDAIRWANTERPASLLDPVKNIIVTCKLLSQKIKQIEGSAEELMLKGEIIQATQLSQSLPKFAESELGWDPKKIDEKVKEMKEQLGNLLTFGEIE